MTRFMADLLRITKGEPPLKILVQSWEGPEGDPRDCVKPGLYDFREICERLSYEYDSGFGAADCHDVTFWTEKHVGFMVEYDGSTYFRILPRNPTESKE